MLTKSWLGLKEERTNKAIPEIDNEEGTDIRILPLFRGFYRATDLVSVLSHQLVEKSSLIFHFPKLKTEIFKKLYENTTTTELHALFARILRYLNLGKCRYQPIFSKMKTSSIMLASASVATSALAGPLSGQSFISDLAIIKAMAPTKVNELYLFVLESII